MRAYGMYNYLHCNPWSPDSVFYVDQLGRVMNINVTLDTALGKPIEVFRFPSDLSSCDRRLCSSIHFTSQDWVTLSDGTGTLYLIHILRNDQSAAGKWELKFNQELGDPFIVLHSVLYTRSEVQIIDALILSIEKDELDVEGSGFHVSLEWISITCSPNDDKYEILKRRNLHGKSVPHYAAIEPDGNSLTIISYKPFRFIADETNQPEEERMEEEEKKGKEVRELFKMTFALPEGAGRAVLSSGSVEVTLAKREVGNMWAEVIAGDTQGEFVADPAQSAAIAERLMHLTSEDLNPNPDCEKPPCNAQELEECDMSLEDSTTLCRFDGNTTKATHVVNLGGNQFLFSLEAAPELMPCFSLRHDVDALMWQPVSSQGDNLWDHAATFNALGYVQASKQDKKFFTCAPNFSYAALCECVRRIFIYRQPTPVSTVLYNRKEGRHVGQVAKQQVASLESSDPILGFQASNERLFVLTTKKLFVIRVNTAG
ncbi:hypothetical protein GDO81_011168 [Engystomops pustulosus]|nr:hypothetical protein GDO81_011168 [Engystomops pustulosus]